MRFNWQKLLVLVNSIRTSPVEYSFSLHEQLKTIPSSFDWYGASNSTDPFTFDGRTVDLLGTNLNFSDPPAYYMFRDTLKENKLKKIFRFRIRQKKCFDFSKCSNESFNYFTTCLKSKKGIYEDLKICSYAYAYYPLLVSPKLKYFACKINEGSGAFVPNSLKDVQENNFWCFSNINIKEIKSDYLGC